jgi:hypothetical protein
MDAEQQKILAAYSGHHVNKPQAIWYLKAGGRIGAAFLLVRHAARSLSKLVVNLLHTFPQRTTRGQ